MARLSLPKDIGFHYKVKGAAVILDKDNHWSNPGFVAGKNDVIPAPDDREVEGWIDRNHIYTRTQDLSGSVSSPLTGKRSQTNWSSIKDIVKRWDVLTSQEQRSIRLLLQANCRGNTYRFWTKDINLEEVLLFNLGLELNNMTHMSVCPMYTNLRLYADTGAVKSYTKSTHLNNPILDPRSAACKGMDAWRKHDWSGFLKQTPMVAYQLMFNMPDGGTLDFPLDASFEDLEAVTDAFFDECVNSARRVAERSGRAIAGIFSKEISVDSILNQTYRPHVHHCFFVHDFGNEQSDLLAKDYAAAVQKRLEGTGIKVSLYNKKNGSGLYLHRIRKTDKLKNMFNYYTRSYSPVHVYKREITAENVEHLNTMTKETFHRLYRLQHGTAGKHHKRIAYYGAPPKLITEDTVLPNLLKFPREDRMKKLEALALLYPKATQASKPKHKSSSHGSSKTIQSTGRSNGGGLQESSAGHGVVSGRGSRSSFSLQSGAVYVGAFQGSIRPRGPKRRVPGKVRKLVRQLHNRVSERGGGEA